METISSRTFSANPIHYLNLAKRGSLAVKRGKMIFRIIPELQPENPSPSGDPYFADQRNVAEMERRFKEIDEGKAKFKVLTPERQKELLGL